MGESKPLRSVETARDAIWTATQFLYYAWFLHDAVRRGAITPETFDDEIVEEGTAALPRRWPREHRTQEDLVRWSWNNVLAAMSISAIAADSALDDALGPKPPTSAALSDRDAARVIVYMLRCANAHDPLNPRWECRGPYLGVFRINALGFELDTTALDGQPWNIAHVGGVDGYFRLLDYCLKLVAAATRGAG